jgi:hypothetical protein
VPGEISDDIKVVRALKSVADLIGINIIIESKIDIYFVMLELSL